MSDTVQSETPAIIAPEQLVEATVEVVQAENGTEEHLADASENVAQEVTVSNVLTVPAVTVADVAETESNVQPEISEEEEGKPALKRKCEDLEESVCVGEKENCAVVLETETPARKLPRSELMEMEATPVPMNPETEG